MTDRANRSLSIATDALAAHKEALTAIIRDADAATERAERAEALLQRVRDLVAATQDPSDILRRLVDLLGGT